MVKNAATIKITINTIYSIDFLILSRAEDWDNNLLINFYMFLKCTVAIWIRFSYLTINCVHVHNKFVGSLSLKQWGLILILTELVSGFQAVNFWWLYLSWACSHWLHTAWGLSLYAFCVFLSPKKGPVCGIASLVIWLQDIFHIYLYICIYILSF